MIPLTVLTVPILREEIKHIYRVSVENLNDSKYISHVVSFLHDTQVQK
jgi:hypothetical protein